MKTILIILFQCLIFFAVAQVQISGSVEAKSGIPLSGANIFIQGSFEGSTTDSLGKFSFSTTLSGPQTLIASFVGFKTQTMKINIAGSITNLKFFSEEETNEINEVAINAGTFEASDKKKSVLLKPIDVALAAGANGDIFGALGTLPGSHRVGEEGRLFVRGGESYETKTFMDGMLINTPYFSKTPDLPTRCRFSPLLFNGAVFSTGGYSAEFGQALSSIVALNTTALEPEDKSSLSLLSVGVQGSHARRWKSSSLALQGELLHMGLSNKIFKQNIHWINEPVIAGSTLMFRQKTSETGMIKTFGSFSNNTSSMIYNNFQESAFQDIALKNSNAYLNTTYNEQLNTNWILNSGIAFNLDLENIKMDEINIQATKGSGQGKVSFTNLSGKNTTTKLGADYLFNHYSQNLRMDGDFLLSFSNHQFSMFLESEVKVTKYFALRSGIRAEFNTLMANATINPRLSAAIKTGEFSQFSTAFGTFTQNPEDEYLKFTAELAPEKSRHSIITWQYKKGTKTLRLEAYYKNYSNLVKFKEEFSIEQDSYSNDGSGYSRGIDIFWRHQKEFGKSDYWISYSWNDSKRNYRDFPVPATPHYVSDHNLSVVYKRFFMKLNSFASATWSFSSGRPYFNPNNPVFMSDRTKAYKDISLGLTHILHLFKTQTIVHLIVNNVCGFSNIYGYTFTKIPDNQGIYHSQPVRPPQKRLAVILVSFQL